MATTHRVDLYSLAGFGGPAIGYVQYTISPELGAVLLPGDTITISGTACRTDDAIRGIQISLYADGGGSFTKVISCNIGQNVAGSFSASFTPDATFFNSLPARIVQAASSHLDFTVSPNAYWIYEEGAGGGEDTAYSFVKYRLAPQIIAMDFERANAAGVWANDGQYLQCKALRIGKNAQAAVGDFTTARITCAGDDGSSRSVNLTQAQLTSALSAAGYSETKPGIFANFASAQGVTYTLTLALGDAYDQIAATDLVMRSFARIDFANAKNGGVAIGMFSTATDAKPKFEVADNHESFFYGGIYAVNNYQLGEVATGGHWIDGKPIYRYVYKGVPSRLSSGIGLIDASMNHNYVDRVIYGYGGAYANADALYGALPLDTGNDNYTLRSLWVDGNGLCIVWGQSLDLRELIVILYYTKK